MATFYKSSPISFLNLISDDSLIFWLTGESIMKNLIVSLISVR